MRYRFGWLQSGSRRRPAPSLQAASILVGQQSRFEWAAVAAAAIAAPLAYRMVENVIRPAAEALEVVVGDTVRRATQSVTYQFVGGMVAREGRFEAARALADAFGNALGASLAGNSSSARGLQEDVLDDNIAELQKPPAPAAQPSFDEELTFTGPELLLPTNGGEAKWSEPGKCPYHLRLEPSHIERGHPLSHRITMTGTSQDPAKRTLESGSQLSNHHT